MNNSFESISILEKKLSQLEDRYQQLVTNESSHTQSKDMDSIPELAELRTENTKLKYRITILKKCISHEKQLQTNVDCNKQLNSSAPQSAVIASMSQTDAMNSVLQSIKELFRVAIQTAFPKLTNPPLLVTRSDHADYQCNSALQLSKYIDDKKMNPRDVANALITHLPSNPIIGNLMVAGPGFINITLNKEFVSKSILNIVIKKVKVRPLECNPNENRVVVDYSSPNIAKEMHVGHLRSTIIGDAVSRVLEFIGKDVLRINHVGDWGTQFGMLLAHLIEKYPDYKSSPPPIADLQAFYKEAKKRFDEDPEFKARAYNTTVRLQSKEAEMITAWTQICEISRKEFREIYKILDVSPHLQERGESYYHEMMIDVVKELDQKGLLKEEEGSKVMFSTDPSAPPLRIVKSDGGFTYDTSDMATLRQRIFDEKASRIIYCVDAGQSQHFQLIFNCAAIADYFDPNKIRCDHLSFGVVLGEDKKKFKTRSGDTVRLKDLIDEGLERALNKLKEKERHKVLTPQELKAAQEAIAIGCIKYADLSHDRNHEYVFSFDRMLDDRGNTAVYLLYALTRIRSIIRNANLNESIQELAQKETTLNLDHQREYKLAKFILRFAEVILQISDDLYLHTLCNYLFELSVVFSEFYDQCYCIEKTVEDGVEKTRVNINRIILCEATARVIETGLSLLGIKSVDKMYIIDGHRHCWYTRLVRKQDIRIKIQMMSTFGLRSISSFRPLINRTSNLLLRRHILSQCKRLKSGSHTCQLNGDQISQTLLSHPLTGFPKTTFATITNEDNETKVTTLGNGFRVASQNKFGQFCTVGIVIDSGSRYEVSHMSGISHFLEKLAFNSTADLKNKDQVMRNLEKFGGICDCQSSRDTLIYATSIDSRGLEFVIHLLSEVVLRPQITDEEIALAKQMIEFELEDLDMKPDPEPILFELIHSAAYRGNTLGLPKFCNKESLPLIDRKVLFDYIKTYHIPSRMVLAGVGIEHEKLVELAEKYFVDIKPIWTQDSTLVSNKIYNIDESISQYTGGLVSVEKDLSNVSLGPTPIPELVHFVLGFESFSHQDEEDFIPVCVLNMLMGGGGSFSAGGPGKGMYTRLYTNVLNKHHWMYSATAYNHAYNDSGLFCIHASANPQQLREMINVIIGETINMTRGTNPVELDRAKSQIKAMLLMNLEMRPVMFEDIARQVLAAGNRKTAQYFIDQIDRITDEDIRRVATKMLRSRVSVAALGNVKQLPSLEDIETALNSKDGRIPQRFTLFSMSSFSKIKSLFV
ncbi:arginine--tRNA ligase, cytoplasmic-like [Oppia nitens]|uniref:arginine--tRNA ligase, cytoplasmic-like n=1 Tax=Oppia nitens TaxID=1686743 RepID=UPI0023DBBD94|nr:arginine--tRNA ligase, cytoplasmic-like [Oppia nitens]